MLRPLVNKTQRRLTGCDVAFRMRGGTPTRAKGRGFTEATLLFLVPAVKTPPGKRSKRISCKRVDANEIAHSFLARPKIKMDVLYKSAIA